MLIFPAFWSKKSEPSRCNKHRNGSNHRHTYIMPVATKAIPHLTEQDKLRFWSKVNTGDTNACWKWTAGKGRFGYGKFRLRQFGHFMAHRIAFVFCYGLPPKDRPFVLHSCDNPACCNPVHLWTGTYLDNARDRMSKGRSGIRVGENQTNAKLTEATVTEAFRRFSLGESRVRLAVRFGVQRSAMGKVINRHSWKHVSNPYY